MPVSMCSRRFRASAGERTGVEPLELRPGQRSLVAGHLGPEGLHERRRPGGRDAEELLDVAAGEEGPKALKTTLKAEIDPDAWATLHSDISRPFDRPESGRIAVKVINHLGDEVMKVFRL